MIIENHSVEIIPATFDIPIEETRDGELTLKWTIAPEIGGAGRGLSVAEVWLIKKAHLSFLKKKK